MNSSSDVQVSIGLSGTELIDPARARLAAERMPAGADVVDTADVFSLLGDPNRLRLLLALLDGELCVHDLAVLTEQSESSTSHALKLLRAHRVVTPRREGRRVYYRLEDPHVRMLLDLAIAHTEHTEASHPEAEGRIEAIAPAGREGRVR